jgi:type III secretion protein J
MFRLFVSQCSVFLKLTIFTLALYGCSSRVELFSGITENEANDALAILINAGIPSTKIPGKEGLVNIDVDQGDVARAITTLRTEGLPREKYAKMGEVFRKEGLISSPLEERARYLWALSQELSATIAQIDGVVKSRVHVVLPERSAGGDAAMPSSAAVFIKHKPGYNLEEVTLQIKRLVSNSIPGLNADRVSVVLVPAMSKIQIEEADAAAAATIKQSIKHTNDKNKDMLSASLIWLLFILFVLILFALAYFTWQKWGKNIRSQIEKSVKKSENQTT